MQKMTISGDEAELLLRLLRADDENNRLNDLEREELYENIDAKLVDVIFDNGGRS